MFQLKITLEETDPPVWRRILVPGRYTFYDLHVAIQNAMGWTDSHLHLFEISRGGGNKPTIIECPFSEPEFVGEKILYTTDYFVRDYLKKAGDLIQYEYDFGDCWRHKILLERTIQKAPKEKYPQCLDGLLACPPEDCGSVRGYYDCIRALKEQDDAEGLLDWLGDWVPDHFDPEEVIFESPRKRLLDCLKD
jgi:hypothetical protein